jgi:hypothetical protein
MCEASLFYKQAGCSGRTRADTCILLARKREMLRIVTLCISITLPALAVTTLLFGAASAGEIRRSAPVGIVELFTSQGCSNCPKADRAIEALAESDDVVTITYHVDYWNYLGWEDTLSAKENTERQYGYAKTLGIRNVFTPQIVLNGMHDAKVSDAGKIEARLASLGNGAERLSVPVTASLSPAEMTISIGDGSGKADVIVAYYKKRTVVEIKTGENEGKKITYRNAVTKLETVGMWDGKALTIKLPAALLAKRGFDGCAILLQSHDANGNPGRILGAASL